MAMIALLALAYTITTPKNSLDDSATLIEVKSGSHISTIADQLAKAHIIRASNAFLVYAELGPAHGQLQAGVYEVKPSQSIRQIVGDMHAGRIAQRTIIVPEGLTNKQVAKKVEQSSFASATDFEAALADQYTNPILAVRPAGVTSLEGLLGPGKYQMVITAKPHDLIERMLANFASSTADFRAKAAPGNLTFYQALAMASMVELEAPKTADRKLIAGVFLNRLHAGMKLESDTTVNYALAQTGTTASSSSQFINLDSPYNTYKIAGLPPTPICNPSLDSIDAVYSPTPSNYLYFIGDRNGEVHYAATYAEHQANISKYLQ